MSRSTSSERLAAERMPEARYAYYRRCQVFRRNGEQCKAPAEKGSHICYAHAAQHAIAFRRDLERRIVLAEAVAEMRQQGRPECEMADLFTDFKGIQVTLAVVARALINGRIDCKIAGQLLVQLQTFSKLLWQIHRNGRKDSPLIHTENTDLKKPPKQEFLPRINADQNKETSKTLPRMNTDDTDLGKLREGKNLTVASSARRASASSSACDDSRILQFYARAFGDGSRAHGPPEVKAA